MPYPADLLEFKTNPPAGGQLDTAQHLHLVADTFFEAQQQRHTADYDGATIWSCREVVSLIERVELAFESWHAIREEPIAPNLSDLPPGKSERVGIGSQRSQA
jgi:hypothetical protein